MSELAGRDRNAVNKIFGSELPETSADERDPDASREEGDRDRWIRENRPPHHGGH